MNAAAPAARHAGAVIAQSLAAHGVRRLFAVPGESYLALLDGLYDAAVDTVVCRQEGGAVYMADATSRMGDGIGVAAVTRGPGAANAFVGIHTAWQDAIPLVLFVGLIPVADRGRESFQEFDPHAWFGTQSKRVLILEDPDRAGEIVAEAFRVAASGRPGPVIVGLPEDVLAAPTSALVASPRRDTATAGLGDARRRELLDTLRRAERPLLYLGGHGWSPESAAQLTSFAEDNRIPVVHEWRSSDRIPFRSPAHAGWLGYGARPTATRLMEDADVVVCLGAVPGDVATLGGGLTPSADSTVIALLADPDLVGTYVEVDLHMPVTVAAAAAALVGVDLGRGDDWTGRTADAHSAYLADSSPHPPETRRATAPGTARMDDLMAALIERLPDDAVVTFGAGNHTSWAQRWFPTRVFPSLLSPRNGSMGYSIPSAVAAALAAPERLVVSIAGDGELLMNGQELATAVQERAPLLAVVMDNGGYGTIRTHQQREYPGRESGTALENPDFAAVARGYGAHAETVVDTADIAGALDRSLDAVAAGRPALIHIIVDPAIAVA